MRTSDAEFPFTISGTGSGIGHTTKRFDIRSFRAMGFYARKVMHPMSVLSTSRIFFPFVFFSLSLGRSFVHCTGCGTSVHGLQPSGGHR